MKKFILFAFLVIFSLSAFSTSPDNKSKSLNPTGPDRKENKMSDEEANNLTKRVTKVRGAENSDQTVIVQEGRNGRRGHGDMNGNHRGHGSIIFVGGGSAILLILLIIILL
jgi:hypothetical protein